MPKQTFLNLPYNKKQKIILAVYDTFIQESYENVTIRSITDKAGISIGSFYKYFDDKDDLYLSLFVDIEKKIYSKQKECSGHFLLDNDIIPITEICTQKEIDFNNTWYNAPMEVMMKFYFGEYSRELNYLIMNELIELRASDKLKDSVNIDFAFHIYVTSMLNISMYFRNNNITDYNEQLKIKKNFFSQWFLNSILKD